MKTTGLLDLFEQLTFGDDFLVQCAALEIATELALSQHGREIMVENGTMNKMEKSLAKSAQDEMHAMVMPSYMKVFGEIDYYSLHRYALNQLNKFGYGFFQECLVVNRREIV